MDLNKLYFQHQISLLRASATRDCELRATHHDHADGLARRINHFQQDAGAAAPSLEGAHHVSVHSSGCGATS